MTGITVTLLLAGTMVLESPAVQTRLVRALFDKVQTSLGGDIKFSSLSIKPFSTFVIKDFAVIDRSPQQDINNKGFTPCDTIISARHLSGTFSPWGLLHKEGVHLSRVNIKDGTFRIVSEQQEYPSNLAKLFRSPRPPEVPVEGPALFDIRSVHIEGFRFRLTNMNKTPFKYRGIGLNWENLDIRSQLLEGRKVRFAGGRLSFIIDHLDAADKSGYKASHISGKAKIGIGQVLLDNFHLEDEKSDINFPKFTMTFRNAYSFQDYVNKVHMEGKMAHTILDGQTLRYFINALPDNNAHIDISPGAKVKGYVNDFEFRNLKFRDKSGVCADIEGRLTGIVRPSSMLVDANVRKIQFTTRNATKMVNSIRPGMLPDLSGLAAGERLAFSGKASGHINRLAVQGSLTSGTGKARARVNIRNLADGARATEVAGQASTSDFNLGSTLGVEALGNCTLRTGFRAKLTPGEPSIIIDSLIVDKLEALQYPYSGIEAAGKLTGKSFDGKIICNDPNLNFLFQGVCDFSKKTSNALYRFYANLGYANLDALNLDPRGIGSKASCQIIANYTRIVKGDGTGSFKVKNIILEDKKGIHDIGTVAIEARNGAGSYDISLKSKFAEGSFIGTSSLPSMIEDIQRLTSMKHLPSLYRGKLKPSTRPLGEYTLKLDLHDSRDLLSFVKPGLYIADSTSFTMSVDKKGAVFGNLTSPRLAYGTNYIKGVNVDIDNINDAINAIISDNELSVGGFVTSNSAVTAYMENDQLSMGIHINENEEAYNFAEIYLDSKFSRDESDSLCIEARPLKSYIRTGSELWDIPESSIRIKGDRLSVDNFSIRNGDQQIRIDGEMSPRTADTLNLDIDNLELSVLSTLTESDMNINGVLDGKTFLVSDSDGKMVINTDIRCDTASIAGSYCPGTGRVDVDADFGGMNLALAEPFLNGILSNLGGKLVGKVGIHGFVDDAVVTSSGLMLDNARMRLDITGAEYKLNGPVSVNNEGIELGDVTIEDNYGGSGSISGGIRYDGLKDFSFDTRIKMKGLNAIDSQERMDIPIYGHLAADADISITGPFNDIRVEGSVSTSGGGQVHVPTNTAVAQSNSDLLTFEEPKGHNYQDPYEELIKEKDTNTRKGKGNISIHVLTNVTPEVKTLIELNKSTNNIISASGNASVLLDINTASGNVSLSGDYLINDGNLHFELPGIVKKEFSVKNGSSIKFNGDILSTVLDITAIYKTKTSLASILADSSSVSSRRLVECTIHISDKLTNPNISFGVNVPDLDPASRTKLAEALNTEDKIQKQFIALLVMRTFLPSEQSGVVNSANILYSNVGELMSNQLNNIFQRLGIPIDLGLGYQQNQGGTDIFDVAISTQLFNNRVEIGGTVGNKQYKTSKNPNGDVVGDIDISIKIDKQGLFKVNLFSHSADEYSSFLDYSQRNGVGIAYQKEYDNFFKMIKDVFTPRKKKEVLGITEEKPVTTIRITE